MYIDSIDNIIHFYCEIVKLQICHNLLYKIQALFFRFFIENISLSVANYVCKIKTSESSSIDDVFLSRKKNVLLSDKCVISDNMH
jgi:hypothetical protein